MFSMSIGVYETNHFEDRRLRPQTIEAARRRRGPHVALSDIRAILASPSLVPLSETPRHPEVMDAVASRSGASGNLLHDAHIAALCIEHGVADLITGDRDFHRFEGLRLHDPFGDG